MGVVWKGKDSEDRKGVAHFLTLDKFFFLDRCLGDEDFIHTNYCVKTPADLRYRIKFIKVKVGEKKKNYEFILLWLHSRRFDMS